MATAYITHSDYTVHDLQREAHAEHAGRIRAVWDVLNANGIIGQCLTISPEEATRDQLARVHTESHLDLLNRIAEQDRTIWIDPDTYALPSSPRIARLAAGACIAAVDAIMKHDSQNALVAIRPPGHHATPSRPMGFCLYSNVAIAARHARDQYNLERVAIIDFDVHHGNGTQDVFYDDPNVLFISTHQYPFYPGTGALRDTGTGNGVGYTLNIPLDAGNGDQNYSRLFSDIIQPALKRFRPQLILVSAGFDAHWVDPLAAMQLSLTGYANLSRSLVSAANELCEGRIAFVMEGGYDLQALSHGMLNAGYALLGRDTISDPYGPAKGHEPDIGPLIERILEVQGL